MRVLNASHVADTGGNGFRTARAFARHRPGWHYRSTARTGNWLAYPVDLPWELALAEWRLADVVHVRDGFQAEALLGAPRRPTVIHQHGTQFRLHRDRLLREQRARGAIGLAATLDLYLMAPDDLDWMPALYELGELEAIRDEVRGARVIMSERPLVIGHAPTNRAVKSTAAFLTAVERLGRELPVRLELIERVPWAECLRRKADVDVYFDQVALGYGNNALEAWAMGIPVIAGAAPATLDEMVRRFDELPFVLADEGSILSALRRLADPLARARWGSRGRAFVERFHSAEVGVELLARVYARAVQQQGGTPMPFDPAAYWLERGKTYERRFRRRPAHAEQEAALLEVLADKPFATILEVGVGFGRIGVLVRERFPATVYIGIEPSPELAASARAKLGAGLVLPGSLEDSTAEGGFDVVLAAEVLMHYPPELVAGAIAKLRALAAPGGRVITVDWAEPLPEGTPIAGHNWLHDWRKLLPVGTKKRVVGRQAIYTQAIRKRG